MKILQQFKLRYSLQNTKHKVCSSAKRRRTKNSRL